MRALSLQTTLVAVLLGTSALVAHAEPENFFADLGKVETTPVANATPAVAAKKVATSRPLDMTPTQSIDDKPAVLDATKLGPDTAKPAPKPVALPVPDMGPASPTKAPLATRPAVVAKPSAPGKAEGLDPEPDGPIVPPQPGPSSDPLDALTAPKPGKADATKAGNVTPDPSANPASDSTKAAVQDKLSPAEAAIKAVLDKREALEIRGVHAGERRKEREAIAFFYAARGFTPLWSANNKAVPAAESILARLTRAGEDALTLSSVPKNLVTEGTADVVAESEVGLTEAVVAYARQATGSRVQPFDISPLIGSKPKLADPSEVLEMVAAAGSAAGDKLQALNPVELRYVALRDKLAETRRSAGPVMHDSIPAGPVLKIGMRDARVPQLRARFNLDVALDADFDGTTYDAQVAAAVTAFQRSQGLPASGTLTKRTVEALSGGAKPAKLEGTLIANMEMWRWMPRDLGADRIEVNIPDFLVTVYHDGVPTAQNRVVVGKLETPTPLFSNTMKYLIVNPYWNVPQSIIKNEMLPKGGGSLSYLSDRGYEVSSHNGIPVVKQLPGDKNALGRIKFLFPNDYSVYLHDTPSKSFFASSKRAFSHGCVRVDKPFAFAEAVLNDTPNASHRAWSQERLEGMLGDKERYVNLPASLPIHLEYFTASVEADGTGLKLRDDVYGYAHAVAAALGQDSDVLPIAGRVKPKPVVAEQPRRRAARIAETAPAPAPVASRSFWDVFDPR